jgi:hypothetical protein
MLIVQTDKFLAVICPRDQVFGSQAKDELECRRLRRRCQYGCRGCWPIDPLVPAPANPTQRPPDPDCNRGRRDISLRRIRRTFRQGIWLGKCRVCSGCDDPGSRVGGVDPCGRFAACARRVAKDSSGRNEAASETLDRGSAFWGDIATDTVATSWRAGVPGHLFS